METDIDANLLKHLRIDSGERESLETGPPRWLWLLLGLLVLALALSGATWWFLTTRAEPVQTAVATAPGAGAANGALLQATGYLIAKRQATVSTQITGVLAQVLIEEGDHVRKGQVIARLEDSAQRAGLGVVQANVQTILAQVAAAQAQLAQHNAELRRAEELAASGMVSKQGAEQARTLVALSSAQLETRRREADTARAQLAQAQLNLDYTVVHAPFDGVVTVKAAQAGEIVSPLSAGGGFTRTGVGTIVDMDSLEVDVDVSEVYIGQVKRDMPCEAVLDAYPDWKIPARVIAVVPAADRGKATVKVRVALDQKDARMVPDMGVHVAFLGFKPDKAAAPPKGALVPAQALSQRDDGTVIFVLVDGRAQLRRVKPAAQDVGGLKLLPEGLKPGEQVLLSPSPSLRDGAEVRLEAPKP